MVILGAGKSTVAAYLFAELKVKGYEVELATDIAKELVWEEDWKALYNQLFIFSNQLQEINKLYGKVEYIITDSPLLLQIGYYKERHLPQPKAFKKLCVAYSNKYNNINIYLKNNEKISGIGRVETETLKPMKYLSTMQFDYKTDCKDREGILNFILGGSK